MFDDPLKLLAIAIGLIMGALFGISGFADAGKTDDLSKNQRVKNVIWLVGGAGSISLFNWKLFSPTDLSASQLADLILSYAGAALAAAVVVIAVTTATILAMIKARATTKPAFRGRAGELALEYIQYGYRYFRTRLDKLDQDAANADEPTQSLAALGAALATILIKTAVDRIHPNRAQREIFIDQVLEAMENSVKLFAGGVAKLKLRTNYMIKITTPELGAIVPLFMDGPLQSYDDFLVLRRYRDGVVINTCLPVERDAQSTRLLPGAPMSAAERTASHINPGKLTFRSGVSARVKAEVKDYFKNASYASVLSVPLIWDRSVVGVVNIESNQFDLVNKGPEMVEQIGNALAPYCVILGELVHRAEER